MSKQDQLDRIKAAVNKKLGRESAAVRISEGAVESDVRNVIPTGISVFDNYLCATLGGLPCGRVTEIYGPEGVGKTSFVEQALAGAQRLGGVAIYNDDEKSFDSDRVKAFGLDPDNCLILQPHSAEESLAGMVVALNALPDDGPPGLLVWDSIAASVPQRELDGEIGDANIGVKARLMSQGLRALVPLAVRKQVALLFVNQIRMKLGLVFGNPETTTGGEMLKYSVSLKVRIGAGKPLKIGKDTVAKDAPFRVYKSRFSPPGLKTDIRLHFGRGWDEVWSTINFAKDQGLIDNKAKGWGAYEDALKALSWEKPWTANEKQAAEAEQALAKASREDSNGEDEN